MENAIQSLTNQSDSMKILELISQNLQFDKEGRAVITDKEVVEKLKDFIDDRKDFEALQGWNVLCRVNFKCDTQK